TYKNLQTIFGIFKLGEFQPLPKLDYVLLFQSSFRPNCDACALDEEEHLFYQVSLVYWKNRRIIVHESKKISEALQIAETLHKQLQLPLKDSSARGKARWRYAGAEPLTIPSGILGIGGPTL
ncbi:MAG: hypothetical protein JNL60_05540, partial [Bacteroidia bacterium]|nr:hypothetical protein [Bacteroidia bacterium]